MSAAVEMDLATLVGEAEDIPCESISHTPNHRSHDDGPATHYVRFHCANCGSSGVKAYCLTFVLRIRPDIQVSCFQCWASLRATDLMTILGPVSGRLS